MKTVLFNVKYSPNLGDGIIAECLEHALMTHDPTLEVVSCDLAGRSGYGEGLNRSRQVVFAILDAMPQFIRRRVTAQILSMLIRTKLREHYRAALDGARAAVVGGGQLLGDADLNFPMKIDAATCEAEALGVATGLYGVGVGGHWSARGGSLFKDAIGRMKSDRLAVRDEQSRRRLVERTGIDTVRLVNDPGLLASRTYGRKPKPARSRPLIGLCVTHPSTLALHADTPKASGRVGYAAFYAQIIRHLEEAGCDVALFTNGAHDDEAFLDRVWRRITAGQALVSQDRVSRMPAFTVPAELANCIQQLDGLVAHRLHANIIAFSYGVPHVGLAWDAKLTAFFDAVSRPGFCVDPAQAGPADIAELVSRALETGIPERSVSDIIETTEREIEALAASLRDSL